jgi:hypothetical protein
MQAWTSHPEGAVTLLSIQGDNWSMDKADLSIILQLRTQIVQLSQPHIFDQTLTAQQLTNCIQQNMEVPLAIRGWSKIIENMMTPDILYASQLSDLMARLAGIRSSTVSKEIIHSKESPRCYKP